MLSISDPDYWPKRIVRCLHSYGVEVWPTPDGRICLSPFRRVPEDVLDVIVAHKQALLDYLIARDNQLLLFPRESVHGYAKDNYA